jgi:hypothetical protein
MSAFNAIFVGLLGTLSLAVPAWGHACLHDPPARLDSSGVYSRMCDSSAYELSSGNCDGGGGVGCRAPQLNPDTSVCGGPFQVLQPPPPHHVFVSSQLTPFTLLKIDNAKMMILVFSFRRVLRDVGLVSAV